MLLPNGLKKKAAVSDLNSTVPSGLPKQKGWPDVRRPDDILAAHAAFAVAPFPSMCGSVRRQPQGQEVQMHRPLPRDVLRAADLPGKPAVGVRGSSGSHCHINPS